MTKERKNQGVISKNPKIIIAGITNINDALMCLNNGIDGISYIFYDDPRKITLETAEKISKNLPPFFHIIGEFHETPVDKVKIFQRRCRLTAMRFTGSENLQYFNRLNIKIIKKINITPDYKGIQKKIDGIFYEYNLFYKIKNSNERKMLFNQIPQIIKNDNYAIISGDITLENINEILKYNVYAIRIQNGAELFIGKKDDRKIKKIIKITKNWNS